tara:strand:- start:55669 stop:55869 length:201 start_codon:yes stop_codon:yes gene_type:complete
MLLVVSLKILIHESLLCGGLAVFDTALHEIKRDLNPKPTAVDAANNNSAVSFADVCDFDYRVPVDI